ncbi:MAG: hypothetical protein RL748_421 [Pseudomonadota bacterium]|jgi:hypothetical protein
MFFGDGMRWSQCSICGMGLFHVEQFNQGVINPLGLFHVEHVHRSVGKPVYKFAAEKSKQDETNRRGRWP